MPHRDPDPLEELERRAEEDPLAALEEREQQTAAADTSFPAPEVPMSDPDLAISQLQNIIDRPPSPQLPPPSLEPIPVLEAQAIEAEQGLEPGSVRSTPLQAPDTIGPQDTLTNVRLQEQAALEQQVENLTPLQKVELFAEGVSDISMLPDLGGGEDVDATEAVKRITGKDSGYVVAGRMAGYMADIVFTNLTAGAALPVAEKYGLTRVANVLRNLDGEVSLADDALQTILRKNAAEDVVTGLARQLRGESAPEDIYLDLGMGAVAGIGLKGLALGAKAAKPKAKRAVELLRRPQADEILEAAAEIEARPVFKAAYQLEDGRIITHGEEGVGSHGQVLAEQDEAVAKLITEGEGEGRVISGFVDTKTGEFMDRPTAAAASGAKVGESSFIDEALRRGRGDDLPYIEGTEQFAIPVDLRMPARNILEEDPGRLMSSFNRVIKEHTANGGSTIDWRTGRSLATVDDGGKDLWSVAKRPGDDMVIEGRDPTPVDVQDFVRRFADDLSEEGAAIGTWNDNGRHVFDVVNVSSDKKRVLSMGAKNGQDAIFNLTKMDEEALSQSLSSGSGMALRAALKSPTGVWGGAVGTPVGAALGAAEGETFDERVRNAALGAVGGFMLGFGLPKVSGELGAAGLRVPGADWWTKAGKEYFQRPENVDLAMKKFADPEAFSGLMQWKGVRGRNLRKALQEEFPDATAKEIDKYIQQGEKFKEARLKQVLETVVVSDVGRVGKGKLVPTPAGKKGDYYQVSNPFATKGGKKFDSMVHALLAEGFETDGWKFYHDVGKVIKEAFGEEDGNMYLKFLAITSTGADAMSTNITNANKAFMLWKTVGKGQPMPDSKAYLFKSVGQRDTSAMLAAATRGVRFSKSEKLHRYHRALLGDENAVVIDLWMNRLFGFGDAVSDTQYRFIEQEIFRIANKTGMAPRDVQAALWAGAKKLWAREVSTKGITDGTAYAPHLMNKMTEMAGEVNSDLVHAAMGEVLNTVQNVATEQSRLFRRAFIDQEIAAQQAFIHRVAAELKSGKIKGKDVAKQKGRVKEARKILRDLKAAGKLDPRAGQAHPVMLVQMLALLGGAGVGAVLGDDPLQGAVLGAAVAGGGGAAILRNAHRIRGVASRAASSGREYIIDAAGALQRRGQTPLLSSTGGLAPSPGRRGYAPGLTAGELHASRIMRSSRVKADLDLLDRRIVAADKAIDEAGLDRADVWNQAQKARSNHDVRWSMHTQLPPEWPQTVKDAVIRAYETQDMMSETLRKQGWLSGDLKKIIEDNEGSYLRRSYRIFSEPDWEHTVKRDHQEVYKTAVNWLEDRLSVPPVHALENMTKSELLTLAARLELGFPVTAAKDELILGLARVTDEDVGQAAEALVNRLLHLGDDHIIGAIKSGKLGKKDLAIIRRRGDIDPVIRALLGEEMDPKANLVRSVHDTSKLIAHHEFQTEIRSMGLRGGWLSHEADRIPEHVVPLTPDSEAFSELAGMYTTKEIAEGFKAFEAYQGFLNTESMLVRGLLKAASIPKMMKTVGSPQTHARNVLSNGGFVAMGADARVVGPKKGISVVEAVNRFRKDEAYRHRLIQLGVVGSGFNVQEATRFFRKQKPEEAMMDAMLRSVDDARMVKGLKKAGRVPGDLYKWEDDIFKLNAFDARMNNISHWRYGVPPEELEPAVREALEMEVAIKVRDHYPTYSIAPRIVDMIRNIPIVGPFVSWSATVPRVAYHQTMDIWRTLQNPASQGEYNHAWARAFGLLAATGGMTAAGTTWNRLNEIDREDELAIREFLPDWDRNGSTAIRSWDRDSMTGSYVPGGQYDPLEMMKAPIRAIIAGVETEEEMHRIIMESIGEAAGPYMDRDLFTAMIEEMLRNENNRGFPIYNESEDAFEQATDLLNHARKTMQPGLFDSFERIANGIREQDPAAVERAVKSMFGYRKSPIDVPEALKYDAKDFQALLSDSQKDLRWGEGEVRAEVEQLYRNQQRLWTQFQRKLDAAIHLGMDPVWIDEILDEAGVRPDIREALLSRQFAPYLSTQAPEDAQDAVELFSPSND